MKGRVIAALQVTILGVVLGAILLETPAQAVAWTDKNHIVTEVQDINMAEYPYTDNSLPGCRFMPVGVSGESGTHQACVANAKDYSLATVTGSDLLHIRIGRDTAYRKIENYIVHSTEVYYVSSAANRLVMKTVQYPRFERLHIYHNFIEHLTPVTTFENGQVRTKYQGDGAPDFVLKYQDGSDTPVNYGQLSSNGRYFVFQIAYSGLARIDTETLEVKRFTDVYAGQYGGASYTFGVSDSGQSVVVTGKNVGITLYQLTGACGVSGVDDPAGSYACSSIDLSEPLEEALGQGIGNTILINTTFINEYKFQTQVAQQNVVFTPTGYTEPRLEYLALGDSFSSGEGDTIRLPWELTYRKGTDEAGPPVERCHISTRSYPYLLAKKYNLQDKGWNSIACSGAHVREDYYGDEELYLGQDKRLSVIETLDERRVYKSNATRAFIPGRVKQLEFVKKYQPKVVTITGTGNDANFGGVLKACVSPDDPGDTCYYANGAHGKTMLGLGIKSQYGRIREVVHAIKDVSPDTTVYYVGYPQFVSDRDVKCGGMVSLSLEERKVFRASTTYLNGIIKAAAESEGAIYVDIESVFETGRMARTLCGSAGPWRINGANLGCTDANSFLQWLLGAQQCNESFHPNHLGHEEIADRIVARHPNLMTARPCGAMSCAKEMDVEEVSVPEMFRKAYDEDAVVNSTPVPGSGVLAAQKGNPAGAIEKSIPLTRPNGESRVYLTSEPTELGTVRSDAAGVLNINIPVPDTIPAGYHTLHVETYSYSGEPIELWWIVLVLGRDGDIDEDGMADSTDKCTFMPELGRDVDQDGVDDGCDLYVGSATQTTIHSSKQDATSLSLLDSNSSRYRSGKDGGLRNTIVTTDQSSAHGIFRDIPRRTMQSSEKSDKSTPSIDVRVITFVLLILLIPITLMLKSRIAYVKKHSN